MVDLKKKEFNNFLFAVDITTLVANIFTKNIFIVACIKI